MRVSQKEMEKSHKRIVEGASRLVRERGIENTNVAEVMAKAGLTNGGFYRHFDSKDALVDAAIQSSFEQMVSFVEARFQEYGHRAAASGYRAYYLSKAHVNQPGNGCPVAALGCDVARLPEAFKAAFGAGVNAMTATLSKGMSGSPKDRRASAIRELAMMAGAVIIARASDPQTAHAVLSACRESSKEV